MFTQKISMDCTKEQYEKYLKDELLKMGYKEVGLSYWGDDNDYITNYYSDDGEVGNINKHDIRMDNATYLGSFNAPLFLALAAMTGKAEGNYGEYVIGLKTGEFYRMREDDIVLPEYKHIRKATKEEIMAKFGEDKAVFPTIAIDITTNSDEKRCYYGSEEQMIALLKSKGYKILKPKTWEEI